MIIFHIFGALKLFLHHHWAKPNLTAYAPLVLVKMFKIAPKVRQSITQSVGLGKKQNKLSTKGAK